MDYEKKYKEALEIAQKLYQDCPNGKNDRLYHTTDLEKMFPELCESEDEKIRKELIEHVKDQQSSFISAPDCRDKYEEEENDKYNAWIAWLEKQGEQKLAWSEEDEKEYKYVLKFVDNILNNCGNKKDYEHCKRCYDWLKSIKQKIKGE